MELLPDAVHAAFWTSLLFQMNFIQFNTAVACPLGTLQTGKAEIQENRH